MASVELFRAFNTLFKQFYIIKKTVGWPSVTTLKGSVETLKALTTISMMVSQTLKVY